MCWSSLFALVSTASVYMSCLFIDFLCSAGTALGVADVDDDDVDDVVVDVTERLRRKMGARGLADNDGVDADDNDDAITDAGADGL